MSTESRVPRFELHIQPMMRLLDRDHMLFKLDLWHYDTVRRQAGVILEFLRNGSMPLKSNGGPWPHEWIELFARWMETGFHRLDFGTATAGLTATRSGTQVSLVAKGTVPSPGFSVWLNLEKVEHDRRGYTLIQEPPVNPAPGPVRTFTARERFETDAQAISLSVTDSQGTHDVPVTVAAFVHLLGRPESVMRDLTAVGGSITPAGNAESKESIMTFEQYELHLASDEVFTEVTGTTESLNSLRRRMESRTRRSKL
jgi:hypothetical protein